jgi:hypothetical protein
MSPRISRTVAALSVLAGSLLMLATLAHSELSGGEMGSNPGSFSGSVARCLSHLVLGGLPTPEIDANPDSIGNALALLVGGLLVLGGLRRKPRLTDDMSRPG